MTAPLTERLEAYAQMVEVALPYAHPGADLLREAKAALEELAAKQRIDEEQCDEMTGQAGQLLERAEAAEERAETLAEALELLLAQPAVRALTRDALGVPSNIGPYQLARDALAGTDGGA